MQKFVKAALIAGLFGAAAVGFSGSAMAQGYYGGGWNTWNGCPPRYTIQDGVCKPYRGY